MKIAIVGSRKYDKKLKIKEFIYELREKDGDELEIVSGGCKTGADKLAKQCCVELEVKYIEFPPAHFPHNQYCVSEPFNYGKPYAVWHYFERNKQIAEYSDYVVAFIPNGLVSNGTNNTIEHANKLEKKVIIIN
jgi:predicted Rossmann fold nucleotide-binding protein DprA/Smf involved in DNA uptake